MLDSSLTISDLSQTSVVEIVQCLNQAFEGYFVEMPSEVSFWRNRFHSSGVRFDLSQGVFEEGRLVAFIINAVGQDDETTVAFNTGTGVIPSHRGKGLVDQMYAYAFPGFANNGIAKCGLEVIDKNERAIKVYARIGFKPTRRLKCFSGTVHAKEKVSLKSILLDDLPEIEYYSWDNRLEALLRANGTFEAFEVFRPGAANTTSGFFVIARKAGYVAQLESSEEDWPAIFSGISQLTDTVRINNIVDSREKLLDYMAEAGIANTIDQFEMEMSL